MVAFFGLHDEQVFSPIDFTMAPLGAMVHVTDYRFYLIIGGNLSTHRPCAKSLERYCSVCEIFLRMFAVFGQIETGKHGISQEGRRRNCEVSTKEWRFVFQRFRTPRLNEG